MGAERAVMLLQAVDLRRTMAANATEALLIAPPQVAAAVGVRRMLWTADGGYLIVVREAAEGTELIAWGRRSGKARTLATFGAGAKVGEIQSMGGTDRFVLDSTEPARGAEAPGTYVRVALVSASSGAFVPLASMRDAEDATLYDAVASERRPVGVVERIDGKSKSWRGFGPDGRLGPEIAVPRLDGLTTDAEGYFVQIHRSEDPKTGKTVREARRLDVARGTSGAWRPWSLREAIAPTEAPGMVVVETAAGDLRGVRAPGVLVSLRGGKPEESGVVSTDGTGPLLSPKGDAVAYLDQGLAMVRTLTRIDRKAYDEALRQRAISEAVNRAKQAGLGILMYAGDKNDVLPGQGVDVRALILPYVRDASLLDGFNYTFSGGSQVDIEKPAETEMGYVSGPGGRAVIYTDGHVKWRPDPS